MKKILGCDIGNVIVGHDTDRNAFNNNNLDKPPIYGAFGSLLACAVVFDRIYLVSKCGERRQAGTLAWLEHQAFYERTTIAKEDVIFCRKRQDKATICNALGITHFIDDRLEILSYIYETNPSTYLYLFNEQEREFNKWQHKLTKSMQRFDNWSQLTNQLICDA